MNLGETIMRITNKQKELIAEKIVKKVGSNFKSKSVAKNPNFVKYKKAKDKADAMWKKYDVLRDVYNSMQGDLVEKIFGEDLSFIHIDKETGKTQFTAYELRYKVIDELHLMELSRHENIDDIINEVSKKFEIK